MAEPPAPAEPTPLNRAEMAARIISGELTTDEAGDLWGELADGPTVEKLKRHDLFDDLARGAIQTTVNIVGGGDADERAALAALARGDTEDAAARFERLIAAATDRKAHLLQVKAALFMFVNTPLAVNALARYLALEPADPRINWSLGLILEAIGELGSAQAYLQKQLEIETKADKHHDAAETLVALGRIAGARDDAELAANRRREALALYEKAGDGTGAARMLGLLAAYDYDRGELTESQASLERALALHEKLEAWDDVASSLLKLGETALDRGELDAAEAFYDRALKLGQAMGKGQFEADALGGIGTVHVNRNDSVRAEPAFERAAKLWEALGEEEMQARMLWVLGIALNARGDTQRAQEQWQQAAALLEKLGLHDELKDLRERMTKLETPKPRPPPPPSEHPLHSLEYFWERIAFGYVTEDDAAAMWRYITVAAAQSGRIDAVKGVSSSVADFKEAVLDINERGDAHERVVLTTLVEGRTDDAAKRYEAVIAQAGDRHKQALWIKGALFAPTDPAIAKEAWERLLPIMPDFHYARCALGKVLERLGDATGAEAAYRAVLANADDDKKSQVAAVDHLGELARTRGDNDGATHYFERSLQLYRELDDTRAVYLTLRVLSALAWTRGEFVLTETYLRQALELAGERTDAEAVLNTLDLIADVAEKRGDFAAAEDVVKNAIGLYEYQGNKAAAATGYERLGDLALKRDDLEAAYTHLDHAREISQKSGDDAGTARAFSSLGLLRIREKDYDHAEWYCKTASDLFEKLGEQGRSAFMLEKLGWIFYLRDDRDEARSQFGRALARYANVGMDEAAKQLREEMAEVEGL